MCFGRWDSLQSLLMPLTYPTVGFGFEHICTLWSYKLLQDLLSVSCPSSGMSHVSTTLVPFAGQSYQKARSGHEVCHCFQALSVTTLVLPYCIRGWGVAGARSPCWSDGAVADQVSDTGVNPCKAHGCRWTHTEVVTDTDTHGSLLCQLTLRPVTGSSSAPN